MSGNQISFEFAHQEMPLIGALGRSPYPMSPETFIEHVRNYCQWVESLAHDLEGAYPTLIALMEGAPGLKTVPGFPPERTFPGLPREVSWADTKRFVDLPFQCYPPVFWPYEMHPEGPWTDNIHEDFAHILAELQHGLQLMEQEGTPQALRYWRDSYFFHWGHHASAAVWAIEWNRNRDGVGEPGVPPNGGPAAPVPSSAVTEGPPSVN